jgi:hypothetical protein
MIFAIPPLSLGIVATWGFNDSHRTDSIAQHDQDYETTTAGLPLFCNKYISRKACLQTERGSYYEVESQEARLRCVYVYGVWV